MPGADIAGIEQQLRRGEHAVRQYDSEAIRDVLMTLVPELERVPERERKVIPFG